VVEAGAEMTIITIPTVAAAAAAAAAAAVHRGNTRKRTPRSHSPGNQEKTAYISILREDARMEMIVNLFIRNN
jgi:hypothetical protein